MNINQDIIKKILIFSNINVKHYFGKINIIYEKRIFIFNVFVAKCMCYFC